MNVRVAYFSATGNTRKVAGAIARGAGCVETEIGGWKPEGRVDLLFLGGAVYANHGHGLHAALKDFIARLDPASVNEVAVFGTGFIHSDAVSRLTSLVEARGIPVRQESFFCLGRFALFNLGHPNAKDLEAAEDFSRQAIEASGSARTRA